MQTNRPKGVAREAQRYELTGVPTSTWYDLQNAGLAPKPIHLGPRSVGWLISELEEWVEARRRERDAAARGSRCRNEGGKMERRKHVCDWPGCMEKTERWFADGWASCRDGDKLLPGLWDVEQDHE